MIKKIDLYIIKKFLGTFVFAIAIIISIVIVFDISEKIDDFIEKEAPIEAIIFDYYFNFIPYFVNLFSPLFTFISVIFFTSKMAANTEIVAILSSGISFKRFLLPFMISAAVLSILSFLLINFVIPPANGKRIDFENRYVRNRYWNGDMNIHKQIQPNEFIYFQSYNTYDNIGYQFSYEKIKNGDVYYKFMSDVLRWDTIKKNWHAENVRIRTIDSTKETLRTTIVLDTTFVFDATEFNVRKDNLIETMNYFELDKFIDDEKQKGSDEVPYFEIEKYQRMAYPLATFILTLIGVAMSSRKVRGGIGLHIGMGMLISFSFILFMQVAVTLATNANVPAQIAVFIPHMIYLVLALYLIKIAPK